MPVYSYKAIDASRASVSGVITGDSPRQARDQLRSQGLSVREIREEEGSGKSSHVGGGLSFEWPQSYQSKIGAMTGELSTLLSVGVPLLESLDTLIKQYKGNFKTSMLVVRDKVEAGSGLAEAMAQQPRVFDSLSVHMVEVGENAGNLEQVLRRLSEFKQKSQEFKDRVLTALTYPAIVLSISIGVSIFLMTFVVPMLLGNLEEAGRELPWPTKVLKFCSDFLLNYGLLLLALFAIGLFGAVMFMKTVA